MIRSTCAAIVVLAALLVLAAPAPEAAATKRCGQITITYSYGSYKFKVWVHKGPISCREARRIMKLGIPITRPDPRGWTCQNGLRGYSDECTARRPRRVVRARVLQ